MPGDQELGSPSFSAVLADKFFHDFPGLAKASEQVLFGYLKEKSFDESQHPDEFAKSFSTYFKKVDGDLYKTFQDVVLGLYFASDKVVESLGEDSRPLFPRGQALPELDTDLLVPVYEKGEIWRPVDSEK